MLQRMFSALRPNDPSSTEFSETRLLVDLSTISKEDKLLMCTAIIRLNYFGLEFQKHDEDTMNIIERDISLQWLSHDLLPTGTLPMFQCPMLQYIDLETGEPTALLIKYFISGAHLRDSFVLYLQEGSDLPIYPHKFASAVKFAEFDELRGNYDLVEQEDKANEEKMTVHSEIPEIEVRLTEFMDSKKSKYGMSVDFN